MYIPVLVARLLRHLLRFQFCGEMCQFCNNDRFATVAQLSFLLLPSLFSSSSFGLLLFPPFLLPPSPPSLCLMAGVDEATVEQCLRILADLPFPFFLESELCQAILAEHKQASSSSSPQSTGCSPQKHPTGADHQEEREAAEAEAEEEEDTSLRKKKRQRLDDEPEPDKELLHVKVLTLSFFFFEAEFLLLLTSILCLL